MFHDVERKGMQVLCLVEHGSWHILQQNNQKAIESNGKVKKD